MTDLFSRLQATVADRYAIERELGRGGMATVYLARDLRHDRLVALKVLHPELASALGSERFLREIQIAAQLNHPHVLGLIDSGTVPAQPGDPEDRPYYIMPYVDGESLRDRLLREKQLPVEDALAITREVAGALGYAHTVGIVHRDIKPENILLSGGHAVVADFGIARAVSTAGSEKLTQTGMAIGTPAYMSPEQGSGERDLDSRADLYALGCVLYEMLAGQPPFTGPTAQAILARHAVDAVPPLETVRRTVPMGVIQAIEKAMAKVPADRFATAGQFVEALDTGGRAGVVRASAARKGVRRPRWLVPAAVVAGLLAIGILLVVRSHRSPIVASASMIAILPFTPSVPDTALTRLGRELMTTVSTTLDQVGEIHTVDRYRILNEANREKPYSIDEGVALGRGFGAASVILGSLVHSGRNVRLDIGLYRTDNHAPLGPSIVVQASPDSLTALSDSITMAVLRQIWRNGAPPSPNLADVTTHSLPALREFLEGERESAAGHYQLAADAYRRAVDQDSTFWVAGWQYNAAQGWMEQDQDSILMRGVEAHLSLFTLRDRMIIETEKTSGTEPYEAHLARAEAVAKRFPDDWPAVFFYADHLVHGGPLIGHTKAEARAALEHVVALNPDLTSAWEHLLQASWGQDSVDVRRATEAWTRLGGMSDLFGASIAEGRLENRLFLQLTASGGRIDEPLMDSVVNAVAASPSGTVHFVASHVLAGYGLPAAAIELNRRVLQRGPPKQFIGMYLETSAFAWADRGAWDSALVALDGLAAAYPERAPALRTYQLAVVGAWLGAVDGNAAAARRVAALQYVNRRQAGTDSTDDRATLAWTDGLLAVIRTDPSALAAARKALQGSRAANARWLDRSLAGFELGLRHLERAAADSLAGIDATVLEDELCSRCDPYVISVNRLAAARGLLAAGDTNRAYRELTWHEARVDALLFRGELFAGRAYLQQAQIDEARGERESAREHYRQFLQRYDMPVASQRHLVVEAEAALRRLSGQRDTSAQQ